MISTVLNDAGPAIYISFPEPLSESDFRPICNASLGPARTSSIIGSNFYGPVVLLDEAVDARDQLQLLGTDQMWKCASWTFARNWARHGGTAYVGLFTVGATYPPNTKIPFCGQTGNVCHQDDIMIVVGFCSLPSISSLTKPDYIYSVRYCLKSNSSAVFPHLRGAATIQSLYSSRESACTLPCNLDCRARFQCYCAQFGRFGKHFSWWVRTYFLGRENTL